MTSVTDDTGEAILARALDALTSSPGTATSPDTSMYPDTGIGPATSGRGDFGKALLTSTDSASLADCSPRSLAAEVDAAFAWIGEKTAGRHKLAVRPSKLVVSASTRPLSVLEIVNDDMPFLLDSVLGEIQARGYRVHLALHPIIKTERSPDGRLRSVSAVSSGADAGNRQESYIAIHCDRLSDADAKTLVDAVATILDQVRVVVADWKPMLARINRAIQELEMAPATVPRDLLTEAVQFLKWLAAGNFTFLGCSDLALSGDAATGELIAVPEAGLGILRDPDVQVLRRGRELVEMTPEIRRFFFGPNPLIITKANVMSRVHRRVHMDYVGIKIYGADGKPKGELRITGLFTSSAYTQSPRQIPMLRHRVARVVEAAGVPPDSHTGKALLNVLETLPRDELFQISLADLERWSSGILDLEIRPRVRVFTRLDRFDRFVSVLVFVPRDRFSTTVRERIGAYLAERFAGVVSAFYPSFAESPLVRVHFIIGRYEGVTPEVAAAELEQAISTIVRTWDDAFGDAISSAPGDAKARIERYGRAFPASYAETFDVTRALEDIQRIERLGPDRAVAIDFYRKAGDPPARVHAAIYRLDAPIRLSERVPVLENLGFSVIDERTYTIRPARAEGQQQVVLHDMVLETADGSPLELDGNSVQGGRLEDCFLAVARGAAESDGFNRLVAVTGATWREAAIVRAYAAYLRQLGSPFGLRYIADTVVRHAGVMRDLLELFMLRFDRDRDVTLAERDAAMKNVQARIESALSRVDTIDEDRILRQLMRLVTATVRTNFYQRTESGEPPETIAFKFAGRDLDMAPEPRTFREIWVASPRVEAVHLRFAPIARGGIRWSDRALDFRTEVLGLAKAQQVKNAVIVPAGAKGGFIPKLLPRGGTREEIAAEGIAAYKIFVTAMLDITDNIVDGVVLPPPRVVRYDGDDPYLVVAADKGTATFSDTANGLSKAHGFWLADAFASGGSAGYDHKGLAITSRGAWECVKRHFREMDRDIQKEPFRVVGVGDMSGDVFGNGMLRSEQTRLVAAFDHRDIFLDPDPDAAKSFIERKRLFLLPRSSWADYDETLISKGGGVFSRNAKSIALSPEVRALLKVEPPTMAPAELMHAILMAEVDLLFFGGIGTYVRASAETDADVGDRANDAIRVNAADLHAKVIGEGANLGMTQRSRIEAATRGIRLNTDFIDNSAGVNTSDQEVNIKIALGPVVQDGRLTTEARNRLLKEMAGDVAAAVLRNNYQQSLALSLAERRAPADVAASARLIRALERRGLLDRRLEALPPDREIAERQRGGRGFVRPELAILSSYAKIALLHDLLASKVPDDPYMQWLLIDYFPPALQKVYAPDLAKHRLKREIIATTLTNGLVNRLGAPTPLLIADEAGKPIADVAFAFMAARSVFGLADLWKRIDALDGLVKGDVQLELYERVRDLLARTTAQFLRDGAAVRDLSSTITRHHAGLAEMRTAFAELVPEKGRARQTALETRLIADGVPKDLAAEIALLPLLADAPVIVATAEQAGYAVRPTARAFLEAGDRFQIDEISERARSIRSNDDYDRLAIAGASNALTEARRTITLAALSLNAASDGGLARWLGQRRADSERIGRDLADIAGAGELNVARLTVAASRLAELARAPASRE